MMRQKSIFTALFILILGIGSFVGAQTKPTYTVGDVTEVGNGKIVIQTKDGLVEVLVSEKTIFKKLPPDNLKLAAAVDSSFSELGIGDKVLIKGDLSADKKSIPADNIYLTTKAALDEKQAKESEQWKTRGISGRVTSLNFEKKEITISVRNLLGETTVVITPKDNAKILRYAPNSNKYSEAKRSNLTEIFIDDVVRALGDKSADGTNFKAEEIVSGAFQTVGGKVKSIDAANNQIVIEDIKTKKDVTVVVGSGSLLKKFPEEMAQRMAQFQAMQASGIRPPQGQNNQANPPQSPPRPPVNSEQTPGQGNGRGMRGDINEMFERMPVISIADLKAGDVIAVSSTKTGDPTKITAIRLLAGIEPFVTAAAMQNAPNGRGRGGQNSNFSIPGLDGFDMP